MAPKRTANGDDNRRNTRRREQPALEDLPIHEQITRLLTDCREEEGFEWLKPSYLRDFVNACSSSDLFEPLLLRMCQDLAEELGMSDHFEIQNTEKLLLNTFSHRLTVK